MTSRVIAMLCATAVAVVAAIPAAAEDAVKIAYVDPLSGGGASIGEVGLKTFQYLADPPSPDAEGNCLFEAQCSAEDFVRAVLEAAQAVWDEYGADIQINLSKDAVKRFMEENNGLVPPGMSISHFQRLNIRRS